MDDGALSPVACSRSVCEMVDTIGLGTSFGVVWRRKAMDKGRRHQINILNTSPVSSIHKSIPLTESEWMASLTTQPKIIRECIHGRTTGNMITIDIIREPHAVCGRVRVRGHQGSLSRNGRRNECVRAMVRMKSIATANREGFGALGRNSSRLRPLFGIAFRTSTA